MHVTAMLFEAIMILCFGASWPMAIWKTLKTRTVQGVSPLFLWLIFIGYGAGIMFKIFDAMYRHHLSPVIVLYILNLLMVGFELMLYYLYKTEVVTPADVA